MSIRDDAEEFAAELRRLKDTTDLSYGALARRLDMNVSTLHRYCAGEGVPKDFAPVERLATFCGATPEERLELHRLWLSAVAARQRVRTAVAPEAAETAEAAEAVLPVPPVQEGLPARTPTPTPTPDTAGDGNGDSDRDVDPTVADRTVADPKVADPTVADPLRRRRRRRVLAVAATCALLVITAATLSALSDDNSSEADASRSAAPRTTAPGAPGRSTKPPATRPSETAAADLPLTWNVDALVWDKGCDHDYVIDKPTARVPPPPLQQDAEAWASSQGAVHGRQTKVRISVQGRSSAAVVLEALHVRVVSRGAPVDGNAYSMGQGCGSDLTPRRFTVDLDEDRPAARPEDGANGAEGGRVIPAVRFPLRVSAEDPEVLDVDATTQTYDARWYLELDWSSQGRAGTIRIDDHGRPFHTTGIKGMPHYWYGTNDAGERAWVPLDGR
ncbi:helix-turn-helix domain-containing protein [Streptomyces caniscabiei]|uniref:Helix-turn-helix transcriptional regulator n=1 Tax=Streptomyces caniscabiei TaxID=2746961 RepID=A0ABU4MFW6_9ACTN|nr:helix-turn-helix transcriptional regulator [Streptomyces caniscabiei]MBE4734976.1 helix-turn-helix domain-containing protein [Streptomyces caniscabiei]MBE4754110.1 helix-turn-helix domain-containing protein [Streptomyces caniscabiei]MBE4784161.1 helix-turn-helix domain-containing protein [Streptomyces caniscabiei]MBE4791340.1 helix-turn-helix domain-containing protein [Streptomyces caniscabiei]MDX2942995.1 helix-turn-helix transcriptional regulator [Streptomyces caniscabiei]